MASIVEAYLLAARHQLVRDDPQAALAEAESGLLHAVSCGYGLLRIELLVTLARRAFVRALELRTRIEHPGTPETELWLARVPALS